MLPILSTIALNAVQTGGAVLTEKVLLEMVKGSVILGLGGLVYKGVETLSEKYSELTVEGHTSDGKSVTVKGRRAWKLL